MTDVFKSYTRTVKSMLLRYDKDLASAFVDNNIDEIWQDHDNWNGGIDTYLIGCPVCCSQKTTLDTLDTRVVE